MGVRLVDVEHQALDAMMADGHIAEPPQLIRIERG